MPSSYAIGDHFEAFVEKQVRQGRYADASEVIREGLRVLEDHEKARATKLQALRADVQRGTDSGASIPAQRVFDTVKARLGQPDPLGTSRP